MKKNCSRFFLFTWGTTVCSSKSSFHAFFLSLLGVDGGCRSRLVDTLLSIVLWQAGYDGLGSPELLMHLFRTLPSTAKISLLDFFYGDILEQIGGSRMFGDTSENYRNTWHFMWDYIKITSEPCRSFCPHVLGSWHFHWLTRCSRVLNDRARL